MSKTETTETERTRDEAAGAQLSTAPQEETAIGGPVLGVVGWIRWFWRQLTSMRVALILLFMLSLGAVPGSLIPQTSADELKVQAFKEAHETLTPIYEKLQFFDVYSSVWFSAIYILLFVSLIGCIVPRTWQFVGQLRSRPPGAPRRLDRLPAYTTWRTEAEPEQVREAALTVLKGRRFRAHTAGDAIAAEKGYLREAGNLLFHVALIVILVAFAWGQLFKSEGGKLIVEGDGFSNTLTQYDDFKSGSQFGLDELEPFSFKLDSFDGTYEMKGPQLGTPRTFEAAVTYTEGGGTDKKAIIRVNEPLKVGDSKVYLIAHGYAPVVTVKDGRGKTVFHGAVPLLPIDNNITSTGAIKVMDGYRNKQGKKEQLGFQAFFVPTFAGAGQGTMFSQFPALVSPAMALTAYYGSLGVDSGLPQNVYQLDKSKLEQFKDESGNKLAQRLVPGGTMTLPDGAGSITFEKEIKEWASFQISQQPGNGLALAGAIAAIAGLTGSLFIQRRRVWVRAVRGEDGVTVVEMAGLGRSESARLPEELGDLAVTLAAQTPPAAPAPEPAEEPAEDPAPSEEADK
ncbi:Ccs1 or ResB-related putative cytochrome C-type biogenesis protein [Streptomyces venezuelae]|uniref:cytochrome c biogenesis protein ResB n=1 Tax=Streptomyces gardneri TaxID=66892 RepID=UPI0006BD4188|nr:cytochrome c biogenesis protein ResB [Streptomyces gardneri]ALO09160.1 Ccs1 or ResB-related putative cytochrome C-type biogenesis protein [Streptomyces venezuelae]QPK46291.1 cytochrome c biogenesis protein ResB [Streptomyces gardneri]WRK37670.1 cytochrome c biogenesis protein ResB [Streptomyces venezuelae]CUM40439.1 Ccs1/ResB-related putative cytochrome C-type biogenesis protein [Streptomyces venezuelae]